MKNQQNVAIKIAVINYPGALRSAVFGLQDMFVLAQRICEAEQYPYELCLEILSPRTLHQRVSEAGQYWGLILPPALENHYYTAPGKQFITDLNAFYAQGCVLSSACAGAFILGATDLLNERQATTHWGLAQQFQKDFPHVNVQADAILVQEERLLTAGGLMSWLDLGLELLAQAVSPVLMRQLGKTLVVDTGQREQRYYRRFIPVCDHGDFIIGDIQQFLDTSYAQNITLAQLAKQAHMGQRSFLRRFVKATSLTPIQYLQKLRVQAACELIESSEQSFEVIAYQVGYQDLSAFRKVFDKHMGLTPGAFRKRFARINVKDDDQVIKPEFD